MFREMRRKGQELTQAECETILQNGLTGVLAVSGDDGYPYAVPLNYVWLDGKIYFHCAKTGHKLDGIARNDKVSFCVVDQERIVAEKYTTAFSSVIVFGRAAIIEDADRKRHAIDRLTNRYVPENVPTRRQEQIEKFWENFCIVEITPEHISGKGGKEWLRINRT